MENVEEVLELMILIIVVIMEKLDRVMDGMMEK